MTLCLMLVSRLGHGSRVVGERLRPSVVGARLIVERSKAHARPGRVVARQ